MIRSTRNAKTIIESRIREAIAGLRPLLRIEESVIELVEFEESSGTARLRIEGGCAECQMSATMLLQGIETHLRTRVPEIRSVLVVAPDAEQRR
jgi:Fe-S cluster biogenesis protein NfuA